MSVLTALNNKCQQAKNLNFKPTKKSFFKPESLGVGAEDGAQLHGWDDGDSAQQGDGEARQRGELLDVEVGVQYVHQVVLRRHYINYIFKIQRERELFLLSFGKVN